MEDLEYALKVTFDDYRLSKNEKSALHDLLKPYQFHQEMLSFVRNKAFEMVEVYMREDKRTEPSALRWLEDVVRTIDQVRIAHLKKIKQEVLFSPGTACRSRIIALLNQARVSVEICVFTISDNEISDAIHKAHLRGVKVRIITDDDKSEDLGSDVDRLQGLGIPTRHDQCRSHMHHKFAIIDRDMLINGSFNWTRSATERNNENITILNGPELIEAFSMKFEELWDAFK